MFFIDSSINPTLLNFFYGLVSLFFANYVIKFIKRINKLPSGPWGLPIVGYLPFIKQDSYNQMIELTNKYGPVFSFKCGQFDVVVINQWKFIKEALINEHLLGRPKETILPGIIDHYSLAEMSGEHWKEQRRVALTTLRDVGFGKSEMENSIRDEIKSFIELIKSSNDKSISITDKLPLSVSNNISTLVFGHKYSYDDPVAKDLDTLFVKGSELIHYFNVATYLPTMASLVVKASERLNRFNLNLFNLADAFSVFKKFESHIDHEVDEHQKKDADNNGIKDYIDGFLNEMTKRQNEKDSTFNLNTLRRNTAMFYGAGLDTIATTSKWMLTLLAKYPEYQNKIRDEIKMTIGMNRQPENVDRQQMPFTMAFIYETLRFSSIVPLNMIRRATDDTKVGDYKIPKDTFVAFNFWSVHHDPNLWDNPDVFKPERFLNEDKSKSIKSQYLLAFSGGRRVCPGESFAYLQLFMYLVSIIQQFEISTEPGKDISLERVYYFILRQKNVPDLICKSID